MQMTTESAMLSVHKQMPWLIMDQMNGWSATSFRLGSAELFAWYAGNKNTVHISESRGISGQVIAVLACGLLLAVNVQLWQPFQLQSSCNEA